MLDLLNFSHFPPVDLRVQTASLGDKKRQLVLQKKIHFECNILVYIQI